MSDGGLSGTPAGPCWTTSARLPPGLPSRSAEHCRAPSSSGPLRMDLPGWQNGGASKGAAVAEPFPHSPCRDPFPGEAAWPLDEGLLPSGAALAWAPRALGSPHHPLGLSSTSAHQARDCVSDTHIRVRRAETQEPALQPWLETQPSQRPELPRTSCLQGPWEVRGWVGNLGVRALAGGALVGALAGGGTGGSSWGLPGPGTAPWSMASSRAAALRPLLSAGLGPCQLHTH